MTLTFFTPPVTPVRKITFPSPHFLCASSVPSDANAAARAIQTSVRTALLKGHRRLCVDVLTAAVDVRARTFDDRAANAVLTALIHAVQPVLPIDTPSIQVIVPRLSAVLRVKRWVTHLPRVHVGVLGVDEPDVDAVVLWEPGVERVVEVRRLLKHLWIARRVVIVVNHPREDDLYRTLGYGGGLPFEMTRFESVFVLAPFALRDEEGKAKAHGERFVVVRQFPSKWALWRYMGKEKRFNGSSNAQLGGEDDGGMLDPMQMEEVQEYDLCAEFDDRPSASQLLQAVQREIG